MTQEMMEALHPDPNKKGTRVTKATYLVYKAALLTVIPDAEEGIYFSDLPKAVEPYLTEDVIRNTSTGWWVTTVKLDLEARGLIERVPGKGKQRLRRV
ncbi:MAG: hypothetical protein M9918_07210 [Anaerolineae bacterium]|nr:hypothetical protein [Anaerolineae bacterium]MCO5195306.1 hypothetical protein [Anaerolineae bacterium]